MADIKTKYPGTSTVPISISLSSLATNAQGVFLAGQESDAVDNSSNLDLDHLLSGTLVPGTSPTVGRSINVYVYACISVSSGTPTYPDVFDGVDSAETVTSANVMLNAVVSAVSIPIDNTTNRPYPFRPISVASLFGGKLPRFWGIFVAHDTGVNLASSGHSLQYERIQGQV